MPSDACKLVTKDEVAAATGRSVEDPDDLGQSVKRICFWRFANQGNDYGVSVGVGQRSSEAVAALDVARSRGAKEVPGLGVPALGSEGGSVEEDSAGADLTADVGTWILVLRNSDPAGKLAQLVPIAKAALAH
jgi:hypothetical protein